MWSIHFNPAHCDTMALLLLRVSRLSSVQYIQNSLRPMTAVELNRDRYLHQNAGTRCLHEHENTNYYQSNNVFEMKTSSTKNHRSHAQLCNLHNRYHQTYDHIRYPLLHHNERYRAQLHYCHHGKYATTCKEQKHLLPLQPWGSRSASSATGSESDQKEINNEAKGQNSSSSDNNDDSGTSKKSEEEEDQDIEFFKANGEGDSASSSSSGSIFERLFSLLGWAVMASAAGFIVSMYQVETEDVEKLLAKYQDKEKNGGSDVDKLATTFLTSYLSYRHYVHSFTDPRSEKLLPDLPPQLQNITYTLVLDLDETIICSDWQRKRGWRTFKRPGIDDFINRMGQMYELVVYTPTLFTYANPILDRLDPKGFIPPSHRLYRDANQMKHGRFMRDISKLNRNPKRVIYITADKSSTDLQPDNSIVIDKFTIDDMDMSKSAKDTVLLDLMPFLEAIVRQQPPDVRMVISSYEGQDIPTTFRQRTQELQSKMKERSSTRPLLRKFIGT